MKWVGPIRAFNIELPEDMHLAVKATAPTRKITLRHAYIEALTAWLQGAAGTSAGGGHIPGQHLSDSQGVRRDTTSTIPERNPDEIDLKLAKLTPSERDAAVLLIHILRRGSEATKKAARAMLAGLSEPIYSGGPLDVTAEGTDISELAQGIGEEVKRVGADKAALERWMEDTQGIKGTPGEISKQAVRPRKIRRK